MTLPRRMRIGTGALLVVALAVAAAAVTAPVAGASPAGDALDHDAVTGTDASYQVEELDGQRYWVGQTLVIEGFDDGETVEFTHEDNFRQRAATDGTVEVTTSNWATGDWAVEGTDSGASGEFTLSEQSLETVAFEPSTASSTSTLEVTSNRAEFGLRIDAEGLDASEIADVVEGGELHGTISGGAYVVTVTDASEELAVRASELGAGTYEFEVDVLDTTASGSATLEVATDASAPVEDLDGQRYWIGQSVEITGFDDGETVAFTHENNVRQRTATDGTVEFESDVWATGEWAVEGERSGASGTMALTEQQLEEVAFDPGRTHDSTQLTVASNRANYRVGLSAENLDADTLADVVDADGVVRNGQYVVDVSDATGTFDVDVTGLQADTYEFEAAVVDTTAAGSATLQVDENVSSAVEDLDGDRLWAGQTIEIYGFADGETVEFRHEGDIQERRLADDGDVAVVTSGWESGEWAIEGHSSGASGTIVLSEQTLDASASDDGRYLTFESNRATFDVVLSADGASADALASAVEGATVEDGRAVLSVTDASRTVEVDTRRLPSGEHEIEATVVDGEASDAATIVVNGTDATAVEDLEGQRYWMGQRLEIGGFDDGETVQFNNGGNFRERTATDGTVAIATTYWALGEWTVEGQSSGASGSFTLSGQFLDEFAFEPETATSATTLSIESARANYRVELTSDDVEAADLAAAIEGATAVGDRVVVDVTDASTTLDVDVSELSGGDYEIEADVVDTTASGTATLSVSAGVEVEGAHPLPYAGSDRLYDVTGDRSITNSDVVDFFGFQHHHPAVDEHPGKFDFDGSGDVGQSDVIELFEIVNGKSIADPDAEFVGGPTDVPEGDVGTITVDVAGTETAFVNVSLVDYDYTATVELTDLDEADGSVEIDANTYQIGHEAEGTFTGEHVAGYTESGGLLETVQNGDNRFTDGFSFRLRSYTDDPRSGANATDVSRLRLTERSIGDVTTWVAPNSTDVENPEQLLGDATESDAAANGDVVIAEVEASGLSGYLGSDAASFDAAGEDLSFYLLTEKDGAFGTSEKRVPIDGDDMTLVRDDANDRFFVAFDTSAVEEIEADEQWKAVFEVGYENSYISGDDEEDNESVAAAFDVEERALELAGDTDDDGRLEVEQSSAAEITAETNVAPGTEGHYFVERQDSVHSGEFTVGYDGVASATFDFADAEAGTIVPAIEFEEAGGETVGTEGVVVPADSTE